MGRVTGDRCFRSCVSAMRGDPRINGVTTNSRDEDHWDSSNDDCWCKMGMTGVDDSTQHSKKYKSCMLVRKTTPGKNTIYVFYYKKLVYKKLDPPRPKR